MPQLGDVLLECRDLTKYYGQGERHLLALERISLTLRQGEFLCLLGASGCGKSTLLRLIAGLAEPSEGEVLYEGRRLRGVNPHASIVFQSFALFPWLTVLENVEVALTARRVPGEARRQKALALIDMVGLDGFEGAYPRELSGGMRQKVGFARALAVEPALLCLDEPFSALDVLSAQSLRGELLELWTSGSLPTKAIIMVTHNIEEAVFMADRIVVMDKDPGRITAQLPVRLPHPRESRSPEYLFTVDRVYAAVAGETPKAELDVLGTAPHEPGKTVALPHVSATGLAGLLEYVSEAGGRQDLYRVGEDLRLEIDDLLPAVEAAELLSFATVEKGDVVLTPLGQTFAEASILARKEIFARRIRRVPIIHWIAEQIAQSERKRLPEEHVLGGLTENFGPEEARRQLDTAINWSRYAELFDYDADSDELFTEAA